MKLMRRAGHTTFSTTLGYIREAETLDVETFGDAFPALPLALLGDFTREDLSNELSNLRGQAAPFAGKTSSSLVGGTGIEPATSGL